MFENIRLSFQGIWSHKLRSFLTMLGIIIGIAAIIAIVSTIEGTNELIKQNMMGNNRHTVKVQLSQDDYTSFYTGSSLFTGMIRFFSLGFFFISHSCSGGCSVRWQMTRSSGWNRPFTKECLWKTV